MKEVEVVCAIIYEQGSFFACKRKDNELLGGKWEFPGGKREKGEDLKETVIREVKEELNSIVSPYEYLGYTIYNYDNLGEDSFTIKLHAFLCSLEFGMLELKVHSAGYFMNYDKLLTLDFAEADKEIIQKLAKYDKRQK